jgi:NADH-quinone oxidoreductase subunit A
MSDLILYLLVFVAVGIGFLATNLLVGKLVRPNRPDEKKLEIYECGEEAVGPSWIQFDGRFYVVALLFVVFDVELALLFPWATVFGEATLAGKLDSPTSEASTQFAWLAFYELLIFVGILLVGFAYLWKRGDLDWIRSTVGQNSRS